jgi:hypothetical protein
MSVERARLPAKPNLSRPSILLTLDLPLNVENRVNARESEFGRLIVVSFELQLTHTVFTNNPSEVKG